MIGTSCLACVRCSRFVTLCSSPFSFFWAPSFDQSLCNKHQRKKTKTKHAYNRNTPPRTLLAIVVVKKNPGMSYCNAQVGAQSYQRSPPPSYKSFEQHALPAARAFFLPDITETADWGVKTPNFSSPDILMRNLQRFPLDSFGA